MRTLATIGYAWAALLFLGAWLQPAAPASRKLIAWVSFERLCLAEFLSCHAVTLLAATAMAREMDGRSEEFAFVYWGLFGLYAFMGGAAYLMHRSHGALLGFYAALIARAFGVAALRSADEAMMRAEVLKNMTMFPAMMVLIAGIAFSERPGDLVDGRAPAWAETGPGIAGLFRKIVAGRTVLYVVVYYLLWTVVTINWPLRIEK